MSKWLVFLFSVFLVAGVVSFGGRYLGLFGEELEAGKPVVVGEAELETIVESVEYEVLLIARDLEVPWSMVFTGDDRMLVAERPGRIRVIENGALMPKALHVFSEVSATSEEGLMGMVLHPNYVSNGLVYACLAYESNDGLVDKVVRFVDEGESVSGVEVVLDNIPAARFHAGCRLGFGPDGKLYVSTGDALEKDLAQDLDSLAGKILRLNDDGSIPEDNPLFNSPIFSYGHRNPQGFDWHPETGVMFETEHGPSVFDGPAGGDEVNVIEGGKNYGWPLVSHENNRDGLESPKLVFTPAVAPGSGSFYASDVIPQFKNNFFFGALKGEGIIRVVLNTGDSSKVEMFEKLEIGDLGRIRDVVTGPDGRIYFSTSNRDGRGVIRDGDDKIYAIVKK